MNLRIDIIHVRVLKDIISFVMHMLQIFAFVSYKNDNNPFTFSNKVKTLIIF